MPGLGRAGEGRGLLTSNSSAAALRNRTRRVLRI